MKAPCAIFYYLMLYLRISNQSLSAASGIFRGQGPRPGMLELCGTYPELPGHLDCANSLHFNIFCGGERL